MTTEFTELNLRQELVQAVTERGYTTPTPIQSGVIPAILARQDVIGQAQTGTGKTAAFALPILQNLLPGPHGVQSLVVVPTRELALQVADSFTKYGAHMHVRVLAVYGGQSYGLQIGRLRRGVDVVVGTPGRLLDLIRKEELKLDQVSVVVLDEADEMLSMGFIEDIEAILSSTPSERQTTLFSATMPAEIRGLAERFLKNPLSITIQREQLTVETIEQRYYLVNEPDRMAALTRLFEVEEISSALIFVRTRVRSGEVANELTNRGFPAEALNGDLSQEAREQIMNRFRQNRIKVLVATDVAARGLDVEGISHVFNYDLPDDLEIYVHRIGRTGRAGKTGIAITLVSPFERRQLRQIEGLTRSKLVRSDLPTEKDILDRREKRLKDQVTVWLRRGRCLREKAMLQELVDEGFDLMDLAAAALKIARGEEKQRPIASLSEVVEPRPSQSVRRGPSGSRPSQGSRGGKPVISHEAGMVRLSLNLGKKDGIRPNDIVGAIAFHADIPGSAIGKIKIQEGRSLVDVPEEFARKVLAKTGEVRIRRMAADVSLARE